MKIKDRYEPLVFSKRDTKELLEMVAQRLSETDGLSLEECRQRVNCSYLPQKIIDCPEAIGHCSMYHLLDMVR